MADTLESIEIQVKHSATGAADEIRQVANAVRTLGKALEKVTPQLSAFNTVMKKTMGKTSFEFSDNSQTVNQTAESITNVKEAAQKAQSSTKEVSRSIKEVSKSASKAKGPLENFISSLKRIAMYRILRSIIKAITQAFQEGLENAYAFSQGIETEGHRFATAMDSMKASGAIMKNQLGSAFISLLAMIAPIVNSIIALVTRLANALAQLFAVFTGGTYLKVNDSAGALADEMAAGGAAAKEWKNQLLGFDVINRLEAPSDGGGGGGGGSPLSDMFEDTEITGWFKALKEKWDDLVNSLDFGPLLKAWDHLKAAVMDFVSILDTALLWAWDNILVPLAHWVIEDLAPASVELLANMFEFLNAVLRVVGPVFEKLWNNVLKPFFKWIGDTLVKGIKWLSDAFKGLAEKINGASSVKEFLQSLNGKETIVLAVAAAIVVLGTAFLIFNAVIGIIGAFSAVIAAITSPIGLAILAIAALIAIGILLYQHWGDIVAWFKLTMTELKQSISDAWNSLTASISNALSNLWNGIVNFYHKANDVAKSILQIMLGILSPITGITMAIINNFQTIITFLRGTFTVNWNAAWQGIVSFFTGIANAIRSIVNAIIAAINSIVNAIRNLVASTSLFSSVSIGGGTPKYATGGFPEDGLFMANHGEMVGKFSNGRTAVANNDQIVEGIKQGVYEATVAAMSTGNGKRNGDIVLNINGREFARATYDDQRAVAKEHGARMVTI